MHPSLSAALVSLAGMALLLPFGSQGQISESTPVTIAIECGSQGTVDEDHRVMLTLTRNGQDVTVTAEVRQLTDAEGICGTLVHRLEPLGIQAHHTETSNSRYKSSPQKAQDLHFSNGWQATRMIVEKRERTGFHGDDGHLFGGARDVV